MGSCNGGGCLRSASASRPVASFIGRVLRCASSWLESLGKEERDYHAAVRFFIFHRKTRVLEFFFLEGILRHTFEDFSFGGT